MNMPSPFEIIYSEKTLSLKEHAPLSLPYKNYLGDYLKKVNSYKPIAHFCGSPVFSLYQPPLATPVGVRSLEGRLNRKFKGEKRPATATLALTKTCQCDCDHCSAFFHNRSVKKELSTAQWKEAFLQTVELGVTTLILLGGEPLLRRDLFELIKSVPKDKATVILFTNGEYLTPKNCASLKEAGAMGAFVSLDTSDDLTHNLFRKRKDLFRKALSGLANLKKAGLVAGIYSHLSRQNLLENQFEKMMELAKLHGAHEVTFFDAIPSGRWLKDTSYCLTPADRLQISKLVKHYRALPNYPGISAQSTMTSLGGSAFCFAANTQFYLTAFGEMCPCDFTPLTIGKFPEESIAPLWDKMTGSQPYCNRAKSCRMQDPEFRKKYIEPLSAKGPFPFPL